MWKIYGDFRSKDRSGMFWVLTPLLNFWGNDEGIGPLAPLHPRYLRHHLPIYRQRLQSVGTTVHLRVGYLLVMAIENMVVSYEALLLDNLSVDIPNQSINKYNEDVYIYMYMYNMYMYIYISIYIYTHTHIYICIHIHQRVLPFAMISVDIAGRPQVRR